MSTIVITLTDKEEVISVSCQPEGEIDVDSPAYILAAVMMQTLENELGNQEDDTQLDLELAETDGVIH